MHVVERGSGTPLVLLHGFGVDHRLLLPLDPAIESSGAWRRIYLDLPGHGGSPACDVSSTEDVVVAVESEIRERLGGEHFAILGSSFGGMIARRVAHDFRDQVLGLGAIASVFVATQADRDVPEPVVLWRDASVLEGLGEMADAYAELAVVHTADNARAFAEQVYPGLIAADQDAMARISQRYALRDEPEDASPAPFMQPTLFVTGRQDQVVGHRDAWARVGHYPRSTFVVLDGAGHNVQIDQPGITSALVADWLERVAAAR
jgi:pimeloyl-ACP methyl ester carboxylesterase